MPLDSCCAGPPVVVTGSAGGGEELGWAWGGRAMAPYMDGLASGVKQRAAEGAAETLCIQPLEKRPERE